MSPTANEPSIGTTFVGSTRGWPFMLFRSGLVGEQVAPKLSATPAASQPGGVVTSTIVEEVRYL